MIPIRHSLASQPNERLQPLDAQPGERNRSWLARAPARGALLLLGGRSITDFRVRVAQSVLRHDLRPSHWSLCGILTDEDRFLSVPLAVPDADAVPAANAIRVCDLADYDDPEEYPNIGTISFANDEAQVVELANGLGPQRSVIDLPGLLVEWLAYAWGVAGAANPLDEGKGVPSAAFVETAYGLAGVELTPSLSSASSCPEAIWQAARWWHQFYEAESPQNEEETPPPGIVPTGTYLMREASASVRAERE